MKYVCEHCKKIHETPSEAEACEKSHEAEMLAEEVRKAKEAEIQRLIQEYVDEYCRIPKICVRSSRRTADSKKTKEKESLAEHIANLLWF